MTSAAFSMPDDRRQRVSIRRRLTTTSTETSSAAAEALEQVLDRKARKREGRPPAPQRSVVLGSAIGGVTGSVDRFGLPQWLFRVFVLGGVAVVLASAAITVARHGGTRYEVAGTAMLEGRPLANAAIVFHKKAADDTVSHTIRTGQDGRFQTDPDAGLPAGLYAVVIQATNGGGSKAASAKIPKAYGNPATTPLRVDVCESLTSLRLNVRKQ
ncbi:MAG: hypothetical protein K8S94_01080 [Planctomycetia bacterium]|nr:hypothetical protein [Planctomycetia bacterium]